MHKFNYCLFLLVALPVYSPISLCHNLGKQQTVYEIEEVDMRILVARDLSKIDVENIEKQLVDSAKNYTNDLEPFSLPPTQYTLTRWIDPSETIDRDFYAPVQDKAGQWKWEIIAKAGTIVNPLKKVRPVTRMLFIDGRSDMQKEFAVAAAKEHPYDLQLVFTQGNPTELSNEIKMPVYYVNQALIDKFELRFTPTLVGVGRNEHQYELAVTEFSIPYNHKFIDRAWYGLEDSDEN